MAEVESFTLDHTAVKAPYIRLIGVEQGPRGDEISNFDVRFVQPNEGEIPTAALHTIEHLIAGYFRDALAERDPSQVVDLSPMGCRTGFYLTVLGEPRPEDVLAATEAALEAVAAHDGEIPGCSEVSCGNWRDHSLPGAKAWAQSVLEGGFIVQDTVPIQH
ncbi:MAG TPA: S-ribosylhomocysteine lyase [Trueperaceae bacterium]